MAIRQRIRVPFDDHVIGQGFNSDTGERVGIGLSSPAPGEDQAADGQTATMRFVMVTSQQSLESSLNISAELEARYMLFSGGAKFSFAKNSAANFSSTYIVGSCVVMNATRFGREFTPTANAQRLLTAGDMDGFKSSFGDRYCQSLRTGGEFYAVVRITSSNTSHQSKIGASLHAELNGLVAAGSFKASFDAANRDASSHTEVNIEVFQMGGQGDQVRLPGGDADKIREHMSTFAASVHQHPVAFEADLLTYDTLALPVPSILELEDKRRVLEDCQVRKQKYWSALSQIDYLLTDEANLIFSDIPSAADLAGLQNEFRRVLNALMTHARAVSSGTIPPTLFVPAREPILPHITRRNTTTFAVWWARRHDADLIADERTLVTKVGMSARKLLATPLNDATAAAVQSAAALIDDLDLGFMGAAFGDFPLHSMASLPKMITSPLRTLRAPDNELGDLSGIETFSHLESVDFERNRLHDIGAISALGGLVALNLRQNQISNIAAVSGLNRLQTLLLDGNSIQTLDSLTGLQELKILMLAASLPVSTVEGQPPPPAVITDNPIRDGSALRRLPQIANPFISSDRLRVRLTVLPDPAGDNVRPLFEQLAAGQDVGTVVNGVATRIANSTEFKFVADGQADSEPLKLAGIISGNELEPVNWVGVLLRNRKKMGVAAAAPGAIETLNRQKLVQRILPNVFSLLPLGLLGMPMEIIVEASPL